MLSNESASSVLYTLSLHDALPIFPMGWWRAAVPDEHRTRAWWVLIAPALALLAAVANFVTTDWGRVSFVFILATLRSEEHTSELQSHVNLVCRLLLEKKKIYTITVQPNKTKLQSSLNHIQFTSNKLVETTLIHITTLKSKH